LINPALIAYTAVETDSEGPRLRLGFAGQAGMPQSEIILGGIEARSILRYLRSNAEFLDSGRQPGAVGRPHLPALSQAGGHEGGRCQDATKGVS
jgi:hypothetical protein